MSNTIKLSYKKAELEFEFEIDTEKVGTFIVDGFMIRRIEQQVHKFTTKRLTAENIREIQTLDENDLVEDNLELYKSMQELQLDAYDPSLFDDELFIAMAQGEELKQWFRNLQPYVKVVIKEEILKGIQDKALGLI